MFIKPRNIFNIEEIIKFSALTIFMSADDGNDEDGGGGEIDPDKIKDFDVSDDDDAGKKDDDDDAGKKDDDADDKKTGKKSAKKTGIDALLDDGDDDDDDDDADKKDADDNKLAAELKDVPKHLRGKDDKATIKKLLGAYKGLRAKGVVPKDVADYKLTLPENVAGLIDETSEEDKPLFDEIKNLAKEHGLSTQQYDGLIGGLIGKFEEMGLIEKPIDPAEHFKVIGEGDEKRGKKIAEVVNNWITGMGRKEILDEKEVAEAKIMAGTDQGVRVFTKIREMAGFDAIPTNFESQDDKMTGDELDARVADKRHGVDAAFTKETERMFEDKYN